MREGAIAKTWAAKACGADSGKVEGEMSLKVA